MSRVLGWAVISKVIITATVSRDESSARVGCDPKKVIITATVSRDDPSARMGCDPKKCSDHCSHSEQR